MSNTNTTPAGLLQQIADIKNMEPGKVCAIKKGKGKSGPYYNLQWRENGRPVSRYVPREQMEAVQENTANYRRFRSLVDEYAQQIIERTREERLGGEKKRTQSSSIRAKRKKSSN